MTARPVPDWVGKRPESMPGQLVLLRLYAKQNGLCACGCGRVMSFERDVIECDHIVTLIDGGENRESNLQLMLQEHHRVKTSGEATVRSAERRHKAKAFSSLRKPSFPTNRNGPLKKKMNGEVVRRDQ